MRTAARIFSKPVLRDDLRILLPVVAIEQFQRKVTAEAGGVEIAEDLLQAARRRRRDRRDRRRSVRREPASAG